MRDRIYNIGQSISGWLFPAPQPRGTSAKRKQAAKIRLKNSGKAPRPHPLNEEKSSPETHTRSPIISTSKGIISVLLLNKIMAVMADSRVDFAIANSNELFAFVKQANLEFSSDEILQLQSFLNSSICNVTQVVTNTSLVNEISSLCSGYYNDAVSLYSLTQNLTDNAVAILQCVTDHFNINNADNQFCYDNWLDYQNSFSKEIGITAAVIAGICFLSCIIGFSYCGIKASHEQAEHRETITTILNNPSLPKDINLIIAGFHDEKIETEAALILKNERIAESLKRKNASIHVATSSTSAPPKSLRLFQYQPVSISSNVRKPYIEMETLSEEENVEVVVETPRIS